MPIYRLILDENGQEDCRDYGKLEDAYQEFVKAKKRGAFSARVDAYSEIDYRHLGVIYNYKMENKNDD